MLLLMWSITNHTSNYKPNSICSYLFFFFPSYVFKKYKILYSENWCNFKIEKYINLINFLNTIYFNYITHPAQSAGLILVVKDLRASLTTSYLLIILGVNLTAYYPLQF